MILIDRMRLHKILNKSSQMGSIFIEIFDVKVLYAIYPMVYISRQYGKLFLVSGNISQLCSVLIKIRYENRKITRFNSHFFVKKYEFKIYKK